MSDETGTFALKNTLNEIRNAYPTISSAFFFKNAKNLAADDNTDDATAQNAATALNAIIKHANPLNGIETVTIQSSNGRVNITSISNLYLTTVTSEETDEQQLNTLTQILVPIVLKLIVKIHPASLASDIFALETTEPAELSEKEPQTAEPDSQLPKPPVNQFIIDNLTGFLASHDTVRIEKAVIAEWKKLYPKKKIEKVDAETLNGKTTRCKFQPLKDSKHEGKGIIQIPEKIQQTLQAKKGGLVMIKPVIK
jgi:hypothetical protein